MFVLGSREFLRRFLSLKTPNISLQPHPSTKPILTPPSTVLPLVRHAPRPARNPPRPAAPRRPRPPLERGRLQQPTHAHRDNSLAESTPRPPLFLRVIINRFSEQTRRSSPIPPHALARSL
jgi:hypothetical protein